MIQLSRKYGALWQLIFYHDISGGLFNNETALCNNEPKKFSTIGMITADFQHGGYYEYLLQYPEVPGYNRWKQKIAIADTTMEQKSDDIGYKKVHIDFGKLDWGGLSRSLSTCCTVFDGSPGIGNANNWYWYAIGSTAYYSQKKLIPGPGNDEYPDGYTVNYVYLWIRVPPKMICSLNNHRKSLLTSLLFVNVIMVS